MPGPVVLPAPPHGDGLRRRVPRRCPGVLVIIVARHRHPGAAASRACPRTSSSGRSSPSRSCTRRTCPRSIGRGSSRSTRASRPRRDRSACRSSQTMRYVVVPQAIRRVIPPLLNDFIGLQKDTVLVSFIGVVEVFRQTQILTAANVQLHARTSRRRSIFLVVTIPLARFTDWLVIRERRRGRDGRPGSRSRGGRRGQALRGCADPTAALSIQGLRKSFGSSRCSRASTSRSPSTRSLRSSAPRAAASRRSCGASTCIEPIDAGRILIEGDEITAKGVDGEPDPATHRDRVPGVQPVPAHDACWTT